MAVALPDELILSILSHLDSLDIARIAAVSRQWHRIVCNNQQLWRNALWIDGERDPTSAQLPSPTFFRHRIDSLLARSGGRLDRLAVVLSVDDDRPLDAEDAKRVLEQLPTLQLRELWLECLGVGGGSESDTLMTALESCSNLDSLHFAAPSSFAFPRSFAGTLLASCALKQLTIECEGMNVLFSDDSLFHMLRKATHVTLMPMFGPLLTQRDFWRLLDRAGATLEHVDVQVEAGLRDGNSAEQDRRPILQLPRLRSLSLVWEERLVGNAGQGTPDRQIVCPELRHLLLHTMHPHKLLESSFDGSFSLLALVLIVTASHVGTTLSSSTPGIGRLLFERHGDTLQRLTIISHATDIFAELSQYPTMILDDITVADSALPTRTLVDLVASRLSNSSYRPIRSLCVAQTYRFDERSEDYMFLKSSVPYFVVCNAGDHSQTHAELQRRVYRYLNPAPLLHRRPQERNCQKEEE